MISMKTQINKMLNKFNYQIIRPFPRPFVTFLKNKIGNKELIGCEIGVFKGEHSRNLIKELNLKLLYLIDPYLDYDEGKEHYGVEQSSLKSAKIKASKLKNPNGKLVFIYRNSCDKETLKQIPDNSLDFVYIDGAHDYENVKKDIENYYKKVKLGGFIAGHDFSNLDNNEHEGVVMAVINFTYNKHIKFHVHQRDWCFKKED